MPPAAASVSTPHPALEQLASEIRARHRSHLRELRLEATDAGVVLHGLARSFYGKQIAFHEVIGGGNFRVAGNLIRVQPPAADHN